MAGFAALLLTGRMNAGHPIASIGMNSTQSPPSSSVERRSSVAMAGCQERSWGSLTIGVLKGGLNVLAVPSSLQVASIGLLVIVALLIDSLRGRP